jgi:choline dehydrogenase-like flavoprotein
MFFDRGSAADYNAWEALGNPGWGWDGLLPYFRKSVTFTPPTREVAEKYNYTYDIAAAYGGKGAVQVSFPPFNWPALDYTWEAWKELGIPKQNEGAGGNAFNAFSAPSALDPVTRTRSYARTAHYDPFKTRPNYHLLTGYQVTEINLDKTLRATGINAVKRGTTDKIVLRAKKEVVIATGAVWTPWLLQRSGIGPSSVLKAAGVPVLKDLPGVGANFQDHPVGGPSGRFNKDAFPNPAVLSNVTFMEEAKKEYETSRTGVFTVARGNQAAFLSLKTVHPQWKETIADFEKQDVAQFLPESYDKALISGFKRQREVITGMWKRNDNAVFEFAFGGGPVGGALQRPLSRGTITINASDPLGNPLVAYRTFSNPIDVSNSIAMFRYSRVVNTAKALAPLAPEEVRPGLNVTSDADIEAYIREFGAPTFAHPSGTAAMVPEELGGVVGSDLRVYGTKGLSVVDASVMPLIPATHLCTTVYAVAEKAADIIKRRTDW